MLNVFRKDLLQIARDRKTLLFLLLMPLMFTFFFGLAFGGLAGGGERALPAVVVVRVAPDAPLAAAFERVLERSPAIVVRANDVAGEAGSPDSRPAARLTIPATFDEDVLAGRGPALELTFDTDATSENAVRTTIASVLERVASAVEIGAIVAGDGGVTNASARLRATGLALDAWGAPPVVVERGTVAAGSDAAPKGTPDYAAAGAEAGPNAVPPTGSVAGAETTPFTQASAGMIVQFAIYGLILSAMLLLLERRSGTMQRLATTRMSRTAVLGGHLLAMFTVVLVQILILVAFGQLAFGVAYARAPAAVLVTSVALAAWSASLGFMLGSISRTEDQVVMGTLIAMFLFSALGGAWFPLDVTGPTFAAIGHATPSAWAMDAFNNVLLRGRGLGAVLAPAGVLTLYTVAFLAIGWWRFRPTA